MTFCRTARNLHLEELDNKLSWNRASAQTFAPGRINFARDGSLQQHLFSSSEKIKRIKPGSSAHKEFMKSEARRYAQLRGKCRLQQYPKFRARPQSASGLFSEAKYMHKFSENSTKRPKSAHVRKIPVMKDRMAPRLDAKIAAEMNYRQFLSRSPRGGCSPLRRRRPKTAPRMRMKHSASEGPRQTFSSPSRRSRRRPQTAPRMRRRPTSDPKQMPAKTNTTSSKPEGSFERLPVPQPSSSAAAIDRHLLKIPVPILHSRQERGGIAARVVVTQSIHNIK